MGKGTTLVHCDRTDIGRRRLKNQDSKAVLPPSSPQQYRTRGWLFLVADGMGAHAAGEMASAIAAERVPLLYEKDTQRSPPLKLRHSIEHVNTEINAQGESASECKGMGTTCTVLAILPRGALVGHIGDSRVYRIRGRTVEQLSRDHSLVWELETAGGMTREQAAGAAPKNIITRSMGPHPRVDVDIEGPFPIEENDVFVLCSDGLSGQVADEEIGLFATELDPRDSAAALLGLSLVRGAPDNVTVIVARAGAEEVSKTLPSDEQWPINDGEIIRPKGHPIPWKMLVACGVSFFLSLVFFSNWRTSDGLMTPILMIATACAGFLAFATLMAVFLKFLSTPSPRVRVLPVGKLLGKGPYRSYDCSPTEPLLEGIVTSLEGAVDTLGEADRERTVEIVTRMRQHVADGRFHEAVVAATEGLALYTHWLEAKRRSEADVTHGKENPSLHRPA